MGFTLAPSLMDQVRALTVRKQAIEAEIESHIAVLATNSSTLRSPLVDPDGFPRSDIDVYAVRGSRVRIIELRNDLDAVMDEIGKALETVYDPKAASLDVGGGGESSSAGGGQTSSADSPPMPFAKVDGVAPNSPAAAAGLQREDLIVQFGHLTRQSFDSPSSLSRLTDLVAASENRTLPIKVLRGSRETIVLRLTPKSGWGGRGMLGCHIIPYSAS